MCVPQGLECPYKILEGRVQADEDVDGPCEVRVKDEVPRIRVGVMCVVLEIVLEEELEDDVDREHVLVHVDTATDLLNLERKGLPRLCCLIRKSPLVDLLDKVGPGIADVGDAAMVCRMVNE